MQFEATRFSDAWLVSPTRARDTRGYFMRTFCAELFGARGLETRFPQHSTSFSQTLGTVRGMHFQRAPHEEAKVVRCLKGAILDVIVDLRPGSPTFRKWQAFELTAENEQQLYIPKGFAHGFQTLTDDVLVGYLISTPYAAEAAAGVRHDDSAFGIAWPLPPTDLSDRDRAYPALAADYPGLPA